jgi:hypothetical protein
MTLNPDGNLAITISATLARPASGATVHVAIGSNADSFAPSGGSGFRAMAGFAIGLGSSGGDRAQSGWPGNILQTADAPFSGTVSAVFSRRAGKWYVSSGSLPEVQITLEMPPNGYLFHGVQGSNAEKVFSSYSISVS